jgi:hypothetical protein
MISPGVGFTPGRVGFIVTRGLGNYAIVVPDPSLEEPGLVNITNGGGKLRLSSGAGGVNVTSGSKVRITN